MNSEFKKDTIKKILRNRKRLETKLKVKIEIKDDEVELSGEEFNVYIAKKVFSALERNFPLEVAMLLTEHDYMLEEIPIKNLTKRNPKQIKARIIGTKGKTLSLLSELSDCYITLHDNTVSIIGEADKIKYVINAIKSLILGSKQANVYKYLEKARTQKFPEDLGLKIKGIKY